MLSVLPSVLLLASKLCALCEYEDCGAVTTKLVVLASEAAACLCCREVCGAAVPACECVCAFARCPADAVYKKECSSSLCYRVCAVEQDFGCCHYSPCAFGAV